MDAQRIETIRDVRLLHEQIEPLKQLNGFQKHHRIPQAVSSGDRQFLAETAHADLDHDLQKTFSALRSAFGFKRKEIAVSGPSGGGGMIETPHFNYEITVAHVDENPAKIVWRRMISGIREPEQIFSDAFIGVFGNQFSILEVSTSGDLDLEAIVDHIEDAELETVTVDYDKDVTWCEIQVAASQASVRIGDDSIRVTSRQEVTPRGLLEAFAEVQQQFMSTLDCRGNPFYAGSN